MTLDPLAARTLKQAHESVREAPDSPEARANAVAAMQAAMSTPPARRARRGLQFLALAAGLGALVASGLALRPETGARVVSEDGAFAAGHRFSPGARVESGPSPLRLELASGVILTLTPHTTLVLANQGVELRVERGVAAAEIAPRTEGFTIDCGDTQVFTRGARLEVSPGAGCDGRTRVEVFEGEATLPDGAVLKPHETWPRCAAAVRLIAPPPAPLPVAPIAEPTRAPRVAPQPSTVTPPKPAQETARAREERLAKQNQLYLEAMSLQRGGDTAGALERLSQVLQDPTSPLAETALAQKVRWLSTTRRDAAREAAREYLRRFPMGFARAEAEQLVLEQP